MRFKRSWLLLAVLFAGASGCATPPDVPICVELVPGREGACIWTISKREQLVNDVQLLDGKTWQELDDVSLRLPPTSAGKIEAYIRKVCKKAKCKNVGKLTARTRRIEAIQALKHEAL